jgi:uncharacterized protein
MHGKLDHNNRPIVMRWKMAIDIDREDVLLLIFDAYERSFKKPTFNGVTRLEKLIFLLGAEAGLSDVEDLFTFRAYKFGPYSKGVYEAAEFLESMNLVDVEIRPYYSYFLAEEEKELSRDIDDPTEEDLAPAGQERLFSLTGNGRLLAQRLREQWKEDRPDELRRLDETVQRYGTLPLNQIIRYVYRRFPKMAERSIHPEAQRLGVNA